MAQMDWYHGEELFYLFIYQFMPPLIKELFSEIKTKKDNIDYLRYITLYESKILMLPL